MVSLLCFWESWSNILLSWLLNVIFIADVNYVTIINKWCHSNNSKINQLKSRFRAQMHRLSSKKSHLPPRKIKMKSKKSSSFVYLGKWRKAQVQNSRCLSKVQSKVTRRTMRRLLLCSKETLGLLSNKFWEVNSKNWSNQRFQTQIMQTQGLKFSDRKFFFATIPISSKNVKA